MKQIPLWFKYQVKGHALVDDDVFEELSKLTWRWHPTHSKTVYASTGTPSLHTFSYMHHMIMKDTGFDHIDRNGLNNQRSNLRKATKKQNKVNQPARQDSKTGYKGVHPVKKEFMASIKVDGKRIYLGRFKNPIDGAIAYDKAAKVHFGEFAYLNFP